MSSPAEQYTDAAHRYALNYYRANYGPYGSSVAGDIGGGVEYRIMEALCDSIPYSLVDPVRDVWEEVFEEMQYYEAEVLSGNLWSSPRIEDLDSYQYAEKLTDTVDATVAAFGLFSDV